MRHPPLVATLDEGELYLATLRKNLQAIARHEVYAIADTRGKARLVGATTWMSRADLLLEKPTPESQRRFRADIGHLRNRLEQIFVARIQGIRANQHGLLRPIAVGADLVLGYATLPQRPVDRDRHRRWRSAGRLSGFANQAGELERIKQTNPLWIDSLDGPDARTPRAAFVKVIERHLVKPAPAPAGVEKEEARVIAAFLAGELTS